MRKIFILLLSILICNCVYAGDTYPFESKRTINDMYGGEILNVSRRSIRKSNDEWKSLTIEMRKAGELKERLGDQIFNIDELRVTGPINNDDYETMWLSSWDGKLKTLDLGEAVAESPEIPEFAFFKMEEQWDFDNGRIYVTCLNKIIFPSNIEKIGRLAFGYSYLQEVIFPDSLIEIGEAAFTDCRKWKTSRLELPPSLEVIGYQAFMNCSEFTGTLVLPESVRVIDGGAFYWCKLSEVTFPEDLEYIGMFAFGHCKFTEINVPNSCLLQFQGNQFRNNYYLETVHIPEFLPYVPESFTENCIELKEANIPSTARYIGEYAFYACEKLSFAELPEGLEYIGKNSFMGSGITDLTLPSTLKEIGFSAFAACQELKSVVSKAVVPPTCITSYELDGEIIVEYKSPFVSSYCKTIYVPEGSEESYRNAPGWDHFKNIIGIDMSDVKMESASESESIIYDLNGRIVKEQQKGQPYIKNKKIYLNR